MSNKRVAVVGCGPSGISALVAFNQVEQKGEAIPEVVAFEKQDGVGGLWNYSWHSGTDKYGEHCHNSMYRYLWSNGPKEVLEFGDYTFAEHAGKPICSYPPRAVLRDYVLARGKKNNVDRFVRFSTIVRHIEKEGEQFVVHSQNLITKEDNREVFDYVIVSSGHFSVPILPNPTYPGIDDFKGRVMHAHDFRDAVAFRGQRMLLIGNSYSAEDIALQCNKYGVKDITLSYRSTPTGFNWPKGIREVPGLVKFENGLFHFVDGTAEKFDMVMFCTGYQHHFPFLKENIRLTGAKNLCFIDGLYKGVLLNKCPNIMYIGMHDQYYTFTMFDAQACYARDYILGKVQIKDEKDRAMEIKEWGERFKACKSGHDEIDWQRDYITDLFKYCDYPEHNHEKRAELLHSWKEDRHRDILTYRNKSYTSVTGDVAPLPAVPWHENMDDSIQGFYRNSPKTRVAVIGCVPSGIAALVAFNQAEKKGETIPEIVAFEKQDEIGGLWNYSWHTGTDKYGEHCHNSMYRYLWSNGPKEVLEMGDYTFSEHFGKPIGSYPPRVVLKDYVIGRAKKNDVDRFVRTSTIVRHVEPKGEQFVINSQNLKTKEGKQEIFDYVIISSGHFSVPNLPIPPYPGIDDFKGRVMHAHDFRDAVGFRGQKMLLIGNSYSAEDIALQCNKYGVKNIALSYRSKPTGFNWPKGIREIPGLVKYENGQFHFADGSSETFDVIMFCTGYQHHFPYLTDEISLTGAKNLCFVDNLYKGVILNKNPKVMYLAMQDQYYTFTMFDAQACYARDYILGKFEIKDKEKTEEIKQWGDRFKTCKTGHDEINYQRDYVADLFKYCDYPEHNHEKRAELLHRWKEDRHRNILTYRNESYASVMTGDVAPLPAIPWVENMDDTLEGFIHAA